MENFLKSRVALVTGASSGIGLEVSIQLLERGAKLYMVGRKLKNLKARISKYDFEDWQINFIEADISNDLDIAKIAREINKEGEIDILVHSAGIIFLGPLENESIENLDKQYRINLRAPYLITQKLLPKIKKARGQIVFVNSTAGLSSWENHSQYSATKYALRAVADSLRKEMLPNGVRVVSVFPGRTDTAMQQHVQKMEGNAYNPKCFLKASEVASAIVCSISLSQGSAITEITIRPNKC
ncbi:MAG: SDR family NAD(P)-dependent oxidoreductase [Chlorobi bacterium]|nr:SDR family NAD(P)-dependent oxidoreductase [Chlorobiota bacterium]